MINIRNKSNISRNEDIDFYKGILMWGVIYGHMIKGINVSFNFDSDFLYAFIRIFDMPFFMILSGYFLNKSIKKKTTIELVWNRTNTILMPILIWTLISGQLSYNKFYFLWAVYASSLICIFSRKVTSMLPNYKIRIFTEYLIYILFIGITYFYYIPWNMFYLFPFFIIGLSLKKISVKMEHKNIILLLFAIGLCFWKSKYTPWETNWNVWREHSEAIIIYVYRFILAILGVFVMTKVLSHLKNIFNGKKIILYGRETLAIYILQAFIVERFFTNALYFLATKNTFHFNQSEMNLIGFILCPLGALAILYSLQYFGKFLPIN